jgi:hypothetical protein
MRGDVALAGSGTAAGHGEACAAIGDGRERGGSTFARRNLLGAERAQYVLVLNGRAGDHGQAGYLGQLKSPTD